MSVPGAPRLSIVIVTYGKREVTERCLDSLNDAFGERIAQDVELVLVDNGSADDTPDLLQSWRDRATVILLEQNRNYAGGNNVGVEAATGEVLVLLNNDTEVGPDVLDALAEHALEPGVALAGARLLYPDGTVQHGGCAWWRGPDGMVRPFHLFRHEAGDLPAALATFDCDVVTAACVAIRRDLFRELGGFDEQFVNGWEDVDLCVRARLAGHRNVYRGDLALIHAEGASRGRTANDEQNEKLFLARYEHLLDEDSARLESQFDATGPNFAIGLHPQRHPWGSAVSVEGEVIGLAGESAEARALLGALEHAELAPATQEWQPTLCTPRLTQLEWDVLERARRRACAPHCLTVQTPIGRLGQLDPEVRGIVRLATTSRQNLSFAGAIWAASPALVDQLVTAGVRADRVEWLPPAIPTLPLGEGGTGLLVLLPAHDLERSAVLLETAAALAGSAPVNLLPTVATEPLAALADSLLPGASLLPPVASDLRFAALAMQSDVVVCGSRSADPFERRALLANAVGAASVHQVGGAAGAVLGDELAVLDGAEPAAWRAGVEAALASGESRQARADRIQAVCGHAALAERLRELVERAQRDYAARAIASYSALARASGVRPLST